MEKVSFAERIKRALPFIARFWVATILLIYAAPKVLGKQFRVLESVYDTPLGQVSDFWLAWSFFGRSYNYQLTLGLAEIAIAFLLIFRRTKTLGALCSLPITINILMVDHFFGVATGALIVASTLLIGAVYILIPEFPRLKAFFWDAQKGASSRLSVEAGLIYGVTIFATTIGLEKFVEYKLPQPYLGAYKIERYSINGTQQTLGPGKYGTDPMLYIEIRNTTVLNLNGKSMTGNYQIDRATREFDWTPDGQAPDTVVKGTYETSGDEMSFEGKNGSDDLEILLKRAAGESR